MKTFYLTTMIAVFLLFCSIGIQAQPSQTKLNQVELAKQLTGNWRLDVDKDTTAFLDLESYGTGFEGYYKSVTDGKIVNEEKELWGYDKKIDKYIVAAMDKGQDIKLYAVWFISKNKYEWIPYGDIGNPEKASAKWEGGIITPDKYVENYIVNNKNVHVDTFTRVK